MILTATNAEEMTINLFAISKENLIHIRILAKMVQPCLAWPQNLSQMSNISDEDSSELTCHAQA